MELREILPLVDHTELNPAATWEDIRVLCDDAVAYGTATVCIPPCYVEQAAAYLDGRLPVCTVIGFPHGNSTTAAKVNEAAQAVADGAAEVDMVINIGWAKDGRFADIIAEIAAIKRAVGDKCLKVIIEACRLTDEEKVALCRCVTEAGADFIKTSTGFSNGGATAEDIRLFAAHVGPAVKIKAAGGIRTAEFAAELIACGAHRIGASALVKLAKEQ